MMSVTQTGSTQPSGREGRSQTIVSEDFFMGDENDLAAVSAVL